jgi:hypothetical protein
MRTERYTTRDRSYGIWHRAPSIARFVGAAEAGGLTMADLDSVLFTEYHYPDKVPLCLVEAAMDIGQEKPTGVIAALAKRANTPAFVVLYTPTELPNPTNTNWLDIESFRVKRIWPSPEDAWRTMQPGQWAKAILQIRDGQLRKYRDEAAANDATY